MATFNFSGAISGLDTTSMIAAIMNAERLPLTRIKNQRAAFKATQTSFGDLRSLLAKLESAAKVFTRDAAGAKRSTTSSDPTKVTATATTLAEAASYTVTVDHLATSTRAQSTASMGTAITGADLATILADLALPGTVTAGQIGMVVDGKIVHAAIGDPTATTLDDALTAIGDALTTQVQANEGVGSTATVTVGVVNNRLQVSLSGTAQSHNVSFGVGGDTSNALGILGLSGTGITSLSASTPMTGRSALGVTRTTVALDNAGLTGLASGAGTLKINGTSIAYNTATDSLGTIIGRINASTAGVVASMDRTNDALVITARTGGAQPISIEDSGTLAAALHLEPGTTDAQTLGTQAQVTIDGRTYLSDTNKLSTAIGGVTLTMLAEGTSTINVTPDVDGLTAALKELVTAFNTLADKLDTLTANEQGQTKGPLAGDTDLRSLALGLRRTLFNSAGVTGAYKSLTQIGLSTGVVGSAKGTTNRLVLDEDKVKAALAQDPTAVAGLLNSTTGAIKPFQDAVASWTKAGGRIDDSLASITSSLKLLDNREAQLQARLDDRQVALEKKFATLEATLAKLQTQSSSLSQQVTQSNKSTG